MFNLLPCGMDRWFTVSILICATLKLKFHSTFRTTAAQTRFNLAPNLPHISFPNPIDNSRLLSDKMQSRGETFVAIMLKSERIELKCCTFFWAIVLALRFKRETKTSRKYSITFKSGMQLFNHAKHLEQH